MSQNPKKKKKKKKKKKNHIHPKWPMGVAIYFMVFFFKKKKKKKRKRNGILRINTYIWCNFKNLVSKNASAVYVSNFLSKKTEMTNVVVILKNLKTLLRYNVIF
jgi:hypothetical protein